MKCGIIMIGIIAVVDTITLLTTIGRLFAVVPLSAIPCFLSLLLMLTNVMLFGRYFCIDSSDTRRRLVVGCAMMVVANIITFVGVSLACIISPELKASHILRLLPEYLIPMVIWAYYRMICQ